MPVGRTVLAVQERQKLFREALCVALQQYLPHLEVVAGVPGARELLDLARRRPVGFVVLEVGAVPWDLPELLSVLRVCRPGIEFVGLATSKRHLAGSGVPVVPRTASPARMADLIQPGSDYPLPFMLTASAGTGKRPLSEQQLKVLSLLSLGLTASQVANRLGLSERGVVKSKQVVFAKLGAQTQSEALRAALAAGILGPSRREVTR